MVSTIWIVLMTAATSAALQAGSGSGSNGISNAKSKLDALHSFASFASNELAAAARSEILPYWRRPVEIETKYDHSGQRSPAQTESPVTAADRNAERAMRRLIEERYPSHGIIGEEYGHRNTEAEYCWVLDPIDGTKSFITGKPLFGTLIGLCQHGVPVVGVIDHAVLNEQWVGIVCDEDNENCSSVVTLNGKKIQTQQGVKKLEDSILYATSPDMFRRGVEAKRFDAVRDACQMTLYGADCYAYALVASGFGAHLVVEADLGVYDYAAVVPVLTGAGGIMTDWNGHQLTLARHEESRGRVVAAANRFLHEQALELLRGEE